MASSMLGIAFMVAEAFLPSFGVLGIGGVADRPQRRSLPRGAALPDALNQTAWSLDAQDDVHASAAYRREAAFELTRRALEEVAP